MSSNCPSCVDIVLPIGIETSFSILLSGVHPAFPGKSHCPLLALNIVPGAQSCTVGRPFQQLANLEQSGGNGRGPLKPSGQSRDFSREEDITDLGFSCGGGGGVVVVSWTKLGSLQQTCPLLGHLQPHGALLDSSAVILLLWYRVERRLSLSGSPTTAPEVRRISPRGQWK